MKRLLIDAGLSLTLFVTTAGASLAIVVGGPPEKACEAPAAAASREHVQR